MSWSGFKKAVSRATTSVMQSAGSVEKTVDPDFVREEARYRSLENKVENLYKESRNYLTAARTMATAQIDISEAVTKFYEPGTPVAEASDRYHTASQSIKDTSLATLNTNFEATVMDPLGKFIAVFPHFNDVIKKRNRKLLDYDATRTKVRKLNERPGEDRTKVDRANQENDFAKSQYDYFNNQLLSEIPKAVELRPQYIEACFEALVKSQFLFNQSVYASLNGIQSYFPETVTEGEAEATLQQMRELAICGNH